MCAVECVCGLWANSAGPSNSFSLFGPITITSSFRHYGFVLFLPPRPRCVTGRNIPNAGPKGTFQIQCAPILEFLFALNLKSRPATTTNRAAQGSPHRAVPGPLTSQIHSPSSVQLPQVHKLQALSLMGEPSPPRPVNMGLCSSSSSESIMKPR